ncbi:MAG: hypothetical protein Q8Q17_02530 [bacterium]|nr:hypothetical protein [bacterium]
MSQATQTNKQMGICQIASALGIPESDVNNELKIGIWAHYIAWSIFFRTGFLPQVHDLGAATAGDILEQLQ